MPRVKERNLQARITLEERYKKAIEGLENGTFSSLQQAATAYGLKKSSLGHQRNGRKSRQEAHVGEQTFTPAAEHAIVQWILKRDDFGFPPRLDHLMQKVRHMALSERKRQIPLSEGQLNPIGKNWIT